MSSACPLFELAWSTLGQMQKTKSHVSSSMATPKAVLFLCAAPGQQVGRINVCPSSSIYHPKASDALQKWFMSTTSPGSGSELQIVFNAAASSAPSSRQANSSAEHPPFWCRQGPCSCLWARCAGSCLEMPTEACVQPLTRTPPGQILQLPDLRHPSLFSFCRGRSESPMPRLEPQLF